MTCGDTAVTIFGEGVCEDGSYTLEREDGVVGGETSCKLPAGETAI